MSTDFNVDDFLRGSATLQDSLEIRQESFNYFHVGFQCVLPSKKRSFCRKRRSTKGLDSPRGKADIFLGRRTSLASIFKAGCSGVKLVNRLLVLSNERRLFLVGNLFLIKESFQEIISGSFFIIGMKARV